MELEEFRPGCVGWYHFQSVVSCYCDLRKEGKKHLRIDFIDASFCDLRSISPVISSTGNGEDAGKKLLQLPTGGSSPR